MDFEISIGPDVNVTRSDIVEPDAPRLQLALDGFDRFFVAPVCRALPSDCRKAGLAIPFV
jgi:hypothetical protein